MTIRVLSLLLALLLAACQSSGGERQGADRSKIAEVNTELGFQYMQKGEYEVAMSKLKKALDADPNHVDAHNAMGVLHATLGQNDEAERSFQRALRLDPANSAALNNYGQFLCQRKRYEEGQRQFLKAVENPLYKLPAAAYSNAGTCAFDAGDLDSAENHFRKALEIDPRLAPALIQMAELSYRLGRYLPARGYLQRYLELARHTATSLWLGIRIERELGDRDALASYGLQLERNFPDAAETKLYLESK
ncbi:MAG: type IV pilus biogenesis/stability protein PilW [Gammaproteobacteria bacterium]|nr:type IV pilus biogenesis/stability protein PilW [Gammaproteobacteria bacterium]MCP5200718.1 type IV pilus biogenesis/stability protein PilW [Gammaproteobacteria bacterium]